MARSSSLHIIRQNVVRQRKTNSLNTARVIGAIVLGGHTKSMFVSSNLNNKAVSVWDEHIWKCVEGGGLPSEQ